MNRFFAGIFTFSVFFSINANADMLFGANAGVDLWYADTKLNEVEIDDPHLQQSYFASVEHLIPLVPNARIRHTNINLGDSATSKARLTDYNQIDFIAYYEFLDNDLISIDAGVGLQQFTGEFLSKEFTEWHPIVYGDVEVGIPTLPISVFATLNMGSFDDTTTLDAEIGAAFIIGLVALDIDIKAGYRMIDHDFNYFDSQSHIISQGFFLGLEIDI